MSVSNSRISEPNTVHHVTSRIAHRVYFLGDEQKRDLLEMLRRSSEFSGVGLLGWAVMNNHFHFYFHLPQPKIVDEEETLRRYGVLKGRKAADMALRQLDEWRTNGDLKKADDWLDAQRRRMYDIGELMKIVKQWFTEDYNRREKHAGTLWEGPYHDRIVPMVVGDMSSVLAYIDLNPVRGAACAGFDDYAWSSFSAATKGDPVAIAGLRFVYQDAESPVDELLARHRFLMEEVLEGWKLRRAEEIARKREAGYEIPSDPLTDEARIAQAKAHAKEVQDALVELLQRRAQSRTRKEKRANAEAVVLAALRTNPMLGVAALCEMLDMSERSVYVHLRALKRRGAISRLSRNAPWIVNAQT